MPTLDNYQDRFVLVRQSNKHQSGVLGTRFFHTPLSVRGHETAMESVTAVLKLAGEVNLRDSALIEETNLTEKTARQLNMLKDGTVVILCEVRCDLDRTNTIYPRY